MNTTMHGVFKVKPFQAKVKLDTSKMADVSLETVNNLESMMNIPYKEHQAVFDYSTSIIRYGLRGSFNYSIPMNEEYNIISGVGTGTIRKLKDNEKLYNIPLKKGNVIVGNNFYSIDVSNISRVLVMNFDV